MAREERKWNFHVPVRHWVQKACEIQSVKAQTAHLPVVELLSNLQLMLHFEMGISAQYILVKKFSCFSGNWN